jgi:hypothetical protein
MILYDNYENAHLVVRKTEKGVFYILIGLMMLGKT